MSTPTAPGRQRRRDQAVSIPGPGGRSDLVLIVDDDRLRSERITRTLTVEGYVVLHATGAVTALTQARQHRPAIVILGEAGSIPERRILCRTLRSDWRSGNPLVLAITSREAAEALDVEADDFLVGEPLDPGRLLARVSAAMDRVRAMRGASPLTGLPGNIAIDEEIRRRFAEGQPIALLYADLDHFKAYNDYYGFLRGDELIRGLADVLRAAAEVRQDTFVGHIGGDDFVVVTRPELAEPMAREIVERLTELQASWYDPRDAVRGWIEVDDRRGHPHRYPLVTISIGMATNRSRPVRDHRILVDVATELKHYAKQQPGNAVAIDRRADGRLRGRHRLVAVAAGPRPGGPRRRRGRAVPRLSQLRTAAVALLLAVLVAGNATVVLASQSRPGVPLWSFKTRLEAWRVALEPDLDDRVALHLGLASRRIGELISLVAMGSSQAVMDQVVADLRTHLSSANNGLAALKRSDVATERLGEIERMLANNIEVLSEVQAAHCQSGGTPAARGCHGLQSALQAATGSPAPSSVRSAVPGRPSGNQSTGPRGDRPATTRPAGPPTSPVPPDSRGAASTQGRTTPPSRTAVRREPRRPQPAGQPASRARDREPAQQKGAREPRSTSRAPSAPSGDKPKAPTAEDGKPDSTAKGAKAADAHADTEKPAASEPSGSGSNRPRGGKKAG